MPGNVEDNQHTASCFYVPLPVLPGRGMPPLGAFLDLNDLSCQQTMSFAVYRFSGFFARSLAQAKHCAAAFIEPVLQVIDPVLLLNVEVSRVRTCDRFPCQPFNLTVNVHVKCHDVHLLSSYYFFATGIPAVVSHHS